MERAGADVAVVPGPKKTPLTTAFPTVNDTVNLTCPETFQIRYVPPWKAVMFRVSYTVPLDPSATVIVWLRLAPSQSRQYRATGWVLLSVKLTSIVKLEFEYHAAAIRLGVADSCSARGSLVEVAQIHGL